MFQKQPTEDRFNRLLEAMAKGEGKPLPDKKPGKKPKKEKPAD